MPKPLVFVPLEDREQLWLDEVIQFSSPNYSTLSTATISVSLIAEYFYRVKRKHGDRKIQFDNNQTFSTNHSFSGEDLVAKMHSSGNLTEQEDKEEASPLWVRILFYILAVLLTLIVGFFQVLYEQCGVNGALAGALLGFWLAVTYELILREPVVKHITDLTNRKKPVKMWVLIAASISIYLLE